MKKFILILLVGVGITVLLLNFMNTGEINIDDFDKIKNSEYQSEVTFLAMIEKAKEEEQKPVGVSGLPNYSKSPNYIHLSGYKYPFPVLAPASYSDYYPKREGTDPRYAGLPHYGMDVVGDVKGVDHPVLSVSKGVVVHTNSVSGYSRADGKTMGTVAVVKTEDWEDPSKTVYLVYMHMKYGSLKVKPDDIVYPGDMLGLMGNTGYSDGVHLHLEARESTWGGKTTEKRLSSSHPDYSFYISEGFTDSQLYELGLERLIGHRDKINSKNSPEHVPYTNYDYHKVGEATKGRKPQSTNPPTTDNNSLTLSNFTEAEYKALLVEQYKYLKQNNGDVPVISDTEAVNLLKGITFPRYNAEEDRYLPEGQLGNKYAIVDRYTHWNTKEISSTNLESLMKSGKLVHLTDNNLGSNITNGGYKRSGENDYKVDSGWVRAEMLNDLQNMVNAAKEDTKPVTLTFTSMLRSYDVQSKKFDKANSIGTNGRTGAKLPDRMWYATPGASEHHSGWVIDFGSPSSVSSNVMKGNLYENEIMGWLQKNAWRYGFVQSFPPRSEDLMGIGEEAWHYRYVGKELSAYLAYHGLSFYEFAFKVSGVPIDKRVKFNSSYLKDVKSRIERFKIK